MKWCDVWGALKRYRLSLAGTRLLRVLHITR